MNTQQEKKEAREFRRGVEVAKAYYKKYEGTATGNVLEDVFPELKDSLDKKMMCKFEQMVNAHCKDNEKFVMLQWLQDKVEDSKTYNSILSIIG